MPGCQPDTKKQSYTETNLQWEADEIDARNIARETEKPKKKWSKEYAYKSPTTDNAKK